MKSMIYIILLLWGGQFTVAQSIFRNSTGTFVVTDKQVYSPGESIWFTSRQLIPATDSSLYHTLFVTLVNGRTKKTKISERFMMNFGISQGRIKLPEDLPSGEYLLYAFTNNITQDRNEQDFHQWISVRRYGEEPFTLPYITPNANDSQILANIKVPGQELKVTLLSDSSHYHKRDSIHWRIRVSDQDGHILNGHLTISCALKSRLRKKGFWNIRNYLYRDQYLDRLDSNVNFGISAELLHPLVGYVTKDRHMIKKRIPLTLMTTGGVVRSKTDALGIFNFDAKDLIAPEGTDAFLSVSKGNNSSFFSIHILDVGKRVSDTIAQRVLPYHGDNLPDSILFSKEEIQYWARRNQIQDSLNSLKKNNDQEMNQEQHVLKVKPVYIPDAFFSNGFSEQEPGALQLNTTLFWAYLYPLKESSDTDLSFLIGDIPGAYTCTIQGIIGLSLVYASADFNVE